MNKMGFLFLSCVVFSCAIGCGGRTQGPGTVATDGDGITMQHQILFSGAGRNDVFDGVMVWADNAFVVRAFAGPGVSLFTVARDEKRRVDTLHIDGLADRIDVVRVGDDINRIYLEGCIGGQGKRQCRVDDEKLIEHYDENGDLVSRSFPDAHGIGLEISYEGYTDRFGRRLPKKITLVWNKSNNKMVILMTAAAPATVEDVDGIDAVLSQE